MKLQHKNILLSIAAIISISSFCFAQAPLAATQKLEPQQSADKVISTEKPILVPIPTPESPAKPDLREIPNEIKKTDPVSEPEPKIYGWKEWVWLIKPEVILRAKLDTGAKNGSVHATNIEKIEIDGKKWIKFTISEPTDEQGSRIRYKAPLIRVSKIKNDRGGIDERYVVPLTFQIGDRKLVAEFNLNDRSKMSCAMLIGRNILEKIGYVDSSRTDLFKKPKHPKSRKSKKTTKSAK